MLLRSGGPYPARPAARHPDDFTTEGRIAKRDGRLYLDIGRNGYAQTMAAPYAVRAKPGAPVSVPLDWSEPDDWVPGRHPLRPLPGLSYVVVAALTGWNDQVTRVAVVEAGFDRHLVKPPYLAEIFDVIACAAQGRGAVT